MSTVCEATLFRWALSILLVASFMRTGVALEEDDFERNNLRRQTSERRPIMYTYYMKKLEHLENDWDTQEHLDMMHMWKNNWEDAGWETRILTDKDAKKHPNFEKYEAMLQKLKISTYNHYCFHRWLAMAVVGGGWMSDYDVIPLTMNAEWANNHNYRSDKFLSYCATVPCLLYGSPEEWDRMATAIMQYVPQHEGEHYSDMKGLIQYVRENPHSINHHNRVGTRIKLLPDGSVDCVKYTGKLAWHFSHHAYHESLKEGIIEDPQPPPKSRAYHMRRFIRDWKNQCFSDQ